MKKRDEIENVIFDLNAINITNPLNNVFLNGWDIILIAPEYFFDDELQLKGIDDLKFIDGSLDNDVLYFYLTEFPNIKSMWINSTWKESYNSEVIHGSEKEQWQFAFSGMYFIPQSESWCGVYVDNIGRDFILLGAGKKLIAKIKKTFDPKYLLKIEDI